MRPILLFKKLLELVEMTSGLVNVSLRLPEWQALKKKKKRFSLHPSTGGPNAVLANRKN